MLTATLSGGIVIGRSSHPIRVAVPLIRALNDGHPVWLRNDSDPFIIARFDPLTKEAAATNIFDEPRTCPTWAHDVIHLIES